MWRATLGLALAAASVVGCGSGNDAANEGTTERAVSAAPTQAASPTPAAPSATDAAVPEIMNFRAPLVGGGELDSAELAGAPVVYWFWAPT